MPVRPWIAAIALGAALPAVAQELPRNWEGRPQLWLNAGFLSHHFERSADYREDNWGIGAEAVLAPAHALVAGNFINSERVRSRYLGWQWRALRWKPRDFDVHAGVALALIDGYPATRGGNAFLAPAPYVALEGRRFGVNFVLLHNGETPALALQLKMRVW